MTMERSSLSPTVYLSLGIIEFAGPEGHRFVVLDNVISHLIAGGVSVNVKGLIVVWVSKEAILCH